jgi:hypothetical protein
MAGELRGGAKVQKASKQFFFEKKNQKTFVRCSVFAFLPS